MAHSLPPAAHNSVHALERPHTLAGGKRQGAVPVHPAPACRTGRQLKTLSAFSRASVPRRAGPAGVWTAHDSAGGPVSKHTGPPARAMRTRIAHFLACFLTIGPVCQTCTDGIRPGRGKTCVNLCRYQRRYRSRREADHPVAAETATPFARPRHKWHHRAAPFRE